VICLAVATPAAMPVLTILLSSAAASLGRWIQLHPEKILPRGAFADDGVTARIYRAQIACMGSFAVFAGTWSTVLGILVLTTHKLLLTRRTALVIGAALAIAAVIYVRREVSAQRRRKSGVPKVWP